MILDSINQIVSIYIFGAGLVVINIPNQLRYVVDIEKELYTKVVFILLLCKPRGIRNISYFVTSQIMIPTRHSIESATIISQ